MKKSIVILFCYFLVLSSLNAQEETKNYDEAFKLIEVWLDAQKDYEKLPGISVAVVKDQETIWSAAYGKANEDADVSTKTTTLCSICSISKLFTSVAIMKLYDEGKLRLDDQLKDILPRFNLKQQFSDSGPITIRTLLTHSSGLPRQADVPYWTGPDFPFPTVEEMTEALNNQETLYPASYNFQYSNLAMGLLGQVVSELSGVSYEDYVIENILTPLNLKDTRPDMPMDLYGKELAIGYSALNRQLERNQVALYEPKGVTPAAGYSSNVLDLAKFASWQFRLRASKEAEILRPSTLKNMHNVHWTNPDFNLTWGLGFSVYKGSDGSKWVGHGGSCPGYRSTLQLNLKTKMAYAVMINASSTNPGKYSSTIHKVLMKTEKLEEQKDNDVNLNDYVGFYNSQPWGSESYCGTWNGKLVSISLPTNDLSESMTMYKHIEGDTFRRVKSNGELAEETVFERDAKGNVIRSKSHQNYSNKMN
ncbi:beta-lactamase family protein [Winogradskyella sp. DF17]|uniref:Beta-lactamase family protein n=1 Tax=Winogradskyella pelagia TaxID=2819984 RepID=A0ABS3T484_9FLAO|nr:serine hydrolase domain-containing protein [Winogradskyella sp. DF17]MBO3117546.1 beta-lactamase family protein [Winogradskyella sp. DF17]